MSNSFKTPILLIIFNRPDTTQRVFDAIKKIKPTQLFVVADGPRSSREHEAVLCATTRAIIKQVDWECDVQTNYSEINLGCKKRVSSGIDWFFDNAEEGIILEDDCLPNETFFQFCEEMLRRYRNDERIGMVSGDNFQFGTVENDYSYYFSKYSHIWGWATWRRAWKRYDVTMAAWPSIKKNKGLHDIFDNKKDVLYWSLIFDDVYNNKIDTWDYQWSFACFVNNYLSVMPSVNLISNIGIGGGSASHTKRINKFANMAVKPIIFPLRHPDHIMRDVLSDRIVQRDNYPFWRFMAKRILSSVMHI